MGTAELIAEQAGAGQEEKNDPAKANVFLTEAAAEHVKRYAKEHGKPVAIRIGVKTSSCSAHAYNFELDDKVTGDDHACESNGVKIAIDHKSHLMLDGTTIDFRKEGLQEGFEFENPNVKGTCGCGESFTV